MHLLTPADTYPDWISDLELQVFGISWGPLKDHEILLADTPSAFARWSVAVAGKEAELLRVVTHPTCLRTGKAMQLLIDSEYYLKEQGVQHVFLEVRESNTAALKLYQRLGWSFYRQRISYYSDGENAHLYEKRL
ncbi:MAG: GNAT family N-acetyltransferase [Holophagaceae bacterium]